MAAGGRRTGRERAGRPMRCSWGPPGGGRRRQGRAARPRLFRGPPGRVLATLLRHPCRRHHRHHRSGEGPLPFSTCRHFRPKTTLVCLFIFLRFPPRWAGGRGPGIRGRAARKLANRENHRGRVMRTMDVKMDTPSLGQIRYGLGALQTGCLI